MTLVSPCGMVPSGSIYEAVTNIEAMIAFGLHQSVSDLQVQVRLLARGVRVPHGMLSDVMRRVFCVRNLSP